MPWLQLSASLFIVACGARAAHGQAPDSLMGRVIREHRIPYGVSIQTDLVSVFNGNGTFTGLYARINLDERLVEPPNGTYTYVKTGADTATLVRTGGGGLTTETMTFATATTGELTVGLDRAPFVLSHAAEIPVLVNTSQRAWVAPGRRAILGFVVPPGRTSLVLVRAVGPGLAQFPGTTPAGDPRVEVYRGLNLIAANDDWEVDVKSTFLDQKANTLAATGYTGAFPLPESSKDAALPLLLGPGNYTVHMIVPDGAPQAEVLGEVYLVP